MASKPPMEMHICNEKECELMDFEGRKFKTMIPHSVGRECVGVTCGYLVLFGKETNDFWLVNPITRHQLHFPDFPNDHDDTLHLHLRMRAILVFSPLISEWLFVITRRLCKKIWFSIAGKGIWNDVSTTSCIWDLHAFKGKIYTINIVCVRGDVIGQLFEMRFGPEPKLMLLKTKNFPKRNYFHFFASYGENLFVVDYKSAVHKLDFGEMKWVLYSDEKTKTEEEFEFYRNHMGYITFAKQESWASCTFKSEKRMFNLERFWYFPHESFDVNLMDEL